jgi:uncharacterized membrane protein YfcA
MIVDARGISWKMTTELPWGEIAAILGVLFATGMMVGFLSGLLGIGGGGLLVPVLFEVYRFFDVPDEYRMHLAIGTSLAVMIPTSLRSFMAHRSRGGVDMGLVSRLALPILLGVITGSLIAKWASAEVLKWIWVIFGSLMAGKMLFGREDWRLGDTVPKSRIVELYAMLVGTISTIMSIGGGAYITVLLTLYGRPIQRAVGTSAGFGPLIAVPGMIGFMWAGWNVPGLPAGSIGYVNLFGFLALVPASVMMAPFGARLAHGISRRTLEIIMGLFIASVSMRFLVAIIAGY